MHDLTASISKKKYVSQGKEGERERLKVEREVERQDLGIDQLPKDLDNDTGAQPWRTANIDYSFQCLVQLCKAIRRSFFQSNLSTMYTRITSIPLTQSAYTEHGKRRSFSKKYLNGNSKKKIRKKIRKKTR